MPCGSVTGASEGLSTLLVENEALKVSLRLEDVSLTNALRLILACNDMLAYDVAVSGYATPAVARMRLWAAGP